MKKFVAVLALTLIALLAFHMTSGDEIEADYRGARILSTGPLKPSLLDLHFEAYDFFNETKVELVEFKHQLKLLSVGDIMAHTPQFVAAEAGDGYDFYPQFELISEKVQSSDFAIGNLETVFAGKDKRYSGKNMIFNAPDNLGESIKKAGFDILTTANNHSLDRGYYGLKRTIEVLDQLELLHTGTYVDETRDILTFEENGFSFALLSYSYSTNGWPIPSDYPNCINMMDKDLIVEDIKRAKALGVDFVIVANHWGLEYHLDENHHQRDLAEVLFYEGADIILGTHPHVLQPFEHKTMVDVSGKEKDKFIIYSQGNFLSGQRKYPRAIGMYINFEFERIGSKTSYVKEVSFMPTYVEDGYKNGKFFMRIHDTQASIMAYENESSDISAALYKNLINYRDTFVEHVSKKSEWQPYLNDNNEYVLYKRD